MKHLTQFIIDYIQHLSLYHLMFNVLCLLFLLVSWLLLSELITQYVSIKSGCNFASLGEFIDGVFAVYGTQVIVAMGVLYYSSVVIYNSGEAIIQVVINTLGAISINIWSEYSLDMMVNLPVTPADRAVETTDKQGYMSILDEISKILPRTSHYHHVGRNLAGFPECKNLPDMIRPNQIHKLGEFERFLAYMQIDYQLKIARPGVYDKFILCLIKSSEWGTKGGMDMAGFNGADQTYTAYQLKSISGSLNNKSPSDYDMYQQTTDVLDVIITKDVDTNNFIKYMRTHPWMFKVGIQTLGQYQGLELNKDILAESIKFYHINLNLREQANYDPVKNVYLTNFQHINNISRADFDHLVNPCLQGVGYQTHRNVDTNLLEDVEKIMFNKGQGEIIPKNIFDSGE